MKLSNTREITIASISGVLAKISTVLVTITIIPVVSNNLPAEEFGFWLLLSSLLLAVVFADFGIGNGLVNVLITHSSDASTELQNEATSTAVFILSALALIVFLLLELALFPILDITTYFQLDETPKATIDSAIFYFSLFLCAGVPCVIGQKILIAHQEVHTANLWQIVGSAFTFLLVIAASVCGGGLVFYAAAITAGPVLGALGSSADQLLRQRKYLIPKLSKFTLQMSRRLIRLGGAWASYQALFFLATSADGIFVTRMFGAEAMASYGLLMRIMQGLAISLFITLPIWPIFSKAVADRNRIRMKQYFYISLLACSSLATIAFLTTIVFAHDIIRLWVGVEFLPSESLVTAFAAWAFTYNIWAGVSALMSNELLLNKMVIVASAGCLITLVLKVPLATLFGPSGICWASVIGVSGSSIVGIYYTIKTLKFMPIQSEI